MVLTNFVKGFTNFFNPNPTQGQRQVQTRQQGQQVQVRQQGQQQTKKQQQVQVKQQGQQQQQQKKQVADFIPQGKIDVPPLKQTSSLFQQQKQQQLTTVDDFTQAIVDGVNQKVQQSRQQLAKDKKQQIDRRKLEQAQMAHQQILGYAREIRSLLSQINEMRQVNKLRQQQTQQSKLKLKKAENDANLIVANLKGLLEQITNVRQQTRRVQQSHINQLKQMKKTLLAQAAILRPAVVAQSDTPQGNKVRIQLAVRPENQCLAQKTRLNFHPVQKTIFI